VFQGAIALSITPAVCEEPSQAGKEALVVEYLASAPWNLSAFMRDLQRTPFLRDIGTTLMRVAVLVSIEFGYEGRLCLFAVPRARGFYQQCKMFDLGDTLYHNEALRRFEMTVQGATEFMGRSLQ